MPGPKFNKYLIYSVWIYQFLARAASCGNAHRYRSSAGSAPWCACDRCSRLPVELVLMRLRIAAEVDPAIGECTADHNAIFVVNDQLALGTTSPAPSARRTRPWG